MNRIRLVLGDWSKDGHEKTEEIHIETSFTTKEIVQAYTNGTEILGFDFVNEVASFYEDTMLETDKLQKLRDLGFKEQFINEEEEDGVPLCADDYLLIYLFIIKLGNPDFQYTFTQEDDSLGIGGYGLFY